jgi:hypothetical protein
MALPRELWQMVPMRIVTLALFCVALPALAEEPMTAAAFEAYVEGRTLTFGNAAGPYGLEHYHDGRRVTWAFIGEECQAGEWYPEGDAICFVYVDEPEPQCWRFFESDRGLRAEFVTDPESSVLYEVLDSEQSLVCPGVGA